MKKSFIVLLTFCLTAISLGASADAVIYKGHSLEEFRQEDKQLDAVLTSINVELVKQGAFGWLGRSESRHRRVLREYKFILQGKLEIIEDTLKALKRKLASFNKKKSGRGVSNNPGLAGPCLF